MKIAIVHDYIKEYGGAERVLESLHEVFPDAPVYTTVYLPKFLGPHRDRFKDWKVKTSILQYLPFKSKLISPIRLIAPFIFKRFNFSKYDVVIVSATGAYNPNVISNVKYPMSNKPIVITYCHTPPRYLYGYATARDWKRNVVLRAFGEIANHFLRQVDYKFAQNVDYFIANSEEVKSRIKKFYRRDSTVIYPPVDIPRGPVKVSLAKSYYLTGGRLARAKHVDLIIKTFEKLNLPLKVFGKGFGGYKEISNIQSTSNIKYVGEISDEEKMNLMENAKAFVFASEDEDFGITPVEAMSVGTPVVAYRSGGVQESVVEGKTGVFFNELISESLSKAIKKFEKTRINPRDCIAQSQKFSKERFEKEISKLVQEVRKGE